MGIGGTGDNGHNFRKQGHKSKILIETREQLQSLNTGKIRKHKLRFLGNRGTGLGLFF